MTENKNQKDRKILTGAIRWDAWIPSNPNGVGTDVGGQVARALNPPQHRFRAPYFSIIDNNGNLDFPEYTMEIWEEELEYAINAGIDYWAYCWYLDSSPMSAARKYHTQSTKRFLLPMCAILGVTSFTEIERNQLFAAMKGNYYLKIDGKPLVYVYGGLRQMGRDEIKELRDYAAQAGLPPLYIVSMVSSSKPDSPTALSSGYDALSFYSYPISNGVGPLTYAQLARKAENRNDITGTQMYEGLPVQIIPSVTAGRDIRPRLDNPVTWAPDYGADNYSEVGTPEEIAEHLLNVLKWTLEHPETTTANAVIMYAWNEHDEGGWICPTIKMNADGDIIYNADGKIAPDTSQLDAIKEAIKVFRKIEAESNKN